MDFLGLVGYVSVGCTFRYILHFVRDLVTFAGSVCGFGLVYTTVGYAHLTRLLFTTHLHITFTFGSFSPLSSVRLVYLHSLHFYYRSRIHLCTFLTHGYLHNFGSRSALHTAHGSFRFLYLYLGLVHTRSVVHTAHATHTTHGLFCSATRSHTRSRLSHRFPDFTHYFLVGSVTHTFTRCLVTWVGLHSAHVYRTRFTRLVALHRLPFCTFLTRSYVLYHALFAPLHGWVTFWFTFSHCPRSRGCGSVPVAVVILPHFTYRHTRMVYVYFVRLRFGLRSLAHFPYTICGCTWLPPFTTFTFVFITTFGYIHRLVRSAYVTMHLVRFGFGCYGWVHGSHTCTTVAFAVVATSFHVYRCSRTHTVVVYHTVRLHVPTWFTLRTVYAPPHAFLRVHTYTLHGWFCPVPAALYVAIYTFYGCVRSVAVCSRFTTYGLLLRLRLLVWLRLPVGCSRVYLVLPHVLRLRTSPHVRTRSCTVCARCVHIRTWIWFTRLGSFWFTPCCLRLRLFVRSHFGCVGSYTFLFFGSHTWFGSHTHFCGWLGLRSTPGFGYTHTLHTRLLRAFTTLLFTHIPTRCIHTG